MLWTFRFLLLLAPPVVGWVTYQLCKELSARDGVPTASRVAVREIPGRLRRGARPASPDAPEAATGR